LEKEEDHVGLLNEAPPSQTGLRAATIERNRTMNRIKLPA
jgi:hypothetical protein